MTVHSRRTLLGLGAAGLTLGALPRAAWGQAGGDAPEATGHGMPEGVTLPDSPPRPPRGDSVGIAVVGLGGYALGQIMPRIEQADRVHLAGLVSGNQEKAARVAAAYGVPEDAIYSYDGFDQIASDDRIDAVYVILPSGLHARYAERAFAAGKHVLCEKPMALSTDECRRMIAASERAGKKLMIGYRCHFEPYNLRAMALMEDEAVGPVRTLRTSQHYRAAMTTPEENWRFDRELAGGGPLEDYGIYGLQSAMYLTGEVPESVFGSTLQPEDDPRFREVFAQVTSELRFPSGAVAQCSTSYDAAGANMALVRGQDGTLTMEPATSYSGNTLRLDARQRSRAFELDDPSTVQFARMLDHFGQAVQEDTAIRTPGEMGLRDVAVMEAIYASAKSGRAEPVSL